MLCGGANLENISKYLEADAAGILIGAAIIKRELVTAGDWASIAGLAKSFVEKVEDFRKCSGG
jgi:2-keto-3-deoxy-6-phosphogluconate aldolase